MNFSFSSAWPVSASLAPQYSGLGRAQLSTTAALARHSTGLWPGKTTTMARPMALARKLKGSEEEEFFSGQPSRLVSMLQLLNQVIEADTHRWTNVGPCLLLTHSNNQTLILWIFYKEAIGQNVLTLRGNLKLEQHSPVTGGLKLY